MSKRGGIGRAKKCGNKLGQQRHRSRRSQSPPAFSEDGWADASQPDNLVVENSSFLQGLLLETGLPVEEGTEVRVFMCGDNPSPSRREQANRLLEFCEGTNLASLEGDERTIAWLDDRSLEGGFHIRSRGKGLKPFELYCELKKPRFPSALSAPSAGDDPTHERQTPEACGSSTGAIDGLQRSSCSSTIDADRRLIFIPNLDASGIYALVRTAPTHQAPALRGALYRYFSRQAFIQTTDLANFELEFHLSYYVWRSSTPQREDPRQHRDGTTVRQSTDISFTHWGKNDKVEYLYEAQVSCVVAGLGLKRWTAHCFADAYFNGDDENDGDDIVQNQEDAESNGGVCIDPLIGVPEAVAPIQDPRVYFLRVFGTRLARVTDEWKLIVKKMGESVKEHNQRRFHSGSDSISGEPSSGTNNDLQTLKRLVDDVNKVMHLSTQFLNGLNETLDEAKRILADGAHFRGFSALPQCRRWFMDIERNYDELHRCQKTLEKVEKSLHTTAETLNRSLALESTQLGHDSKSLTLETIRLGRESNRLTHETIRLGRDSNRLTHETIQLGRVNKVLSIIMIVCVSPVALAASFFSMDDKVMPFLPPNPKSFAGVLVFFAGMSVLPFLVPWISNKVLKLCGRNPPTMTLNEEHFDLGRCHHPTTDEENLPS